MDDQLLAEQYAKTGNLMDLCSDPTWLEESARIEDETGGQIEAGLVLSDYQRRVNALTSEQANHLRTQVKLQSTLFMALHAWMNDWNLGAGFQGTYTIARRLVRQHLAAPSPALQQFVEEFLAEASPVGSDGKPTQQQVIALLAGLLTPDDWQVLAEAASRSIKDQVLKTGLVGSKTVAA
jgi:hypothetical protein